MANIPADWLKMLAEVHGELPDPNNPGGEFYLGAGTRIEIMHADGFPVGAFIVQDDFWEFVATDEG